jgi:hypothetical protein
MLQALAHVDCQLNCKKKWSYLQVYIFVWYHIYMILLLREEKYFEACNKYISGPSYLSGIMHLIRTSPTTTNYLVSYFDMDKEKVGERASLALSK